MLSWVQLYQQIGSAIIRPTHKCCHAPAWKIAFINPENLFMGVNKVHMNITVKYG